MLWKWHLSIGGERTITVLPETHQNIRITGRERWWNILFNIDLCLWIASFFVTLPHPWDLIYHIVSEGFFAAAVFDVEVFEVVDFVLAVAFAAPVSDFFSVVLFVPLVPVLVVLFVAIGIKYHFVA